MPIPRPGPTRTSTHGSSVSSALIERSNEITCGLSAAAQVSGAEMLPPWSVGPVPTGHGPFEVGTGVAGRLAPAVGETAGSGVPVAATVGSAVTAVVGGGAVGGTAVAVGETPVAGGAVAGPPPGVVVAAPLGLGPLEHPTTSATRTRGRANRLNEFVTPSFSNADQPCKRHQNIGDNPY